MSQETSNDVVKPVSFSSPRFSYFYTFAEFDGFPLTAFTLMFGNAATMLFIPYMVARQLIPDLPQHVFSSRMYAGVGCDYDRYKLCIVTDRGNFDLTLEWYDVFAHGFGAVSKYRSETVIPRNTTISAVLALPLGNVGICEPPGSVFDYRRYVTRVPVYFKVTKSTNTLIFVNMIAYNRAMWVY